MLAIFAFFNEIYQADRQWRSCRQDTRVKNNDGLHFVALPIGKV